MLKLLFLCSVRVSELVRIGVGDVDLNRNKIFIDCGKGTKGRYILFPAAFRLVLESHLKAHPKNRDLFETQRYGPFTLRRLQQIVQTSGIIGIIRTSMPRYGTPRADLMGRHQMLDGV